MNTNMYHIIKIIIFSNDVVLFIRVEFQVVITIIPMNSNIDHIV